MSRRSRRTQDERDSASRRSSGRTRKLTEKYQALTGSKLLPTDSANIASEDIASPTKIANPDELLQVIKPRRRCSTSIARSDSPQAVASLLPAHVVSPKVNEEAKHGLTASDVVEESPKRALRRERKPTAKYLESIAAPEASNDLEGQNKRTSQRRRRSSAKAVDMEAASSPPESSVSLQKAVPQRAGATTSPEPSASPAQFEAKSEVTVPRKRSVSPSNKVSQAKAPRLSEKAWSQVPEYMPAASAKAPTSPRQSPAKPKPTRLSLKPPRRPSNLRFAVSNAEDRVGNTAHDHLGGRITASPAYQTKNEMPGRPVNGDTSKPQKVVTLRYGVAPARLSQMHDATPIRFSPMVAEKNEAEAGEKDCNLSCLSPSSRILAFAQLAAESTDSDEDEEDDDDSDDDLTTRPSSRGLYKKWIARGQRFCVCSKQAGAHGHPTAPKHTTSELQEARMPNGDSTSTTKDPFLSNLREEAEKAAAFPPVNSVMPVSEGRRVSALYSAITDNASAARLDKSSESGTTKQSSKSATTKPRQTAPTKSKSYDERMSEDYRALEAIRHQATMEGVKARNTMDYNQIKALLDEHRLDASNGIGHGHGLVKVGSIPIMQ